MRFIADGLLKHLRPHGDDDFIDRLNYYYTPTLFLLAAAVVSGKQYVAKPIQCWIPPQFTRSMEEYIETYCWIQNTYWVPAHEHIPDEIDARESRQIGYYQWVPFILLLQGFLFTLPCVWWRLTNRRSGLDLNQMITSIRDAQIVPDRLERSGMFSCIVQCFSDVLDLQSGLFPSNDEWKMGCSLFRWCNRIQWRRSGFYVTISYLFTKFLYAGNSIGQFFLLNSFLSNDSYEWYGFRVVSDLISGREWSRSGHFPRVTLCDFQVRTVGNLNRYSVQCALTVNVFNEKIFVFIWIWLCVLALLTGANLFSWFISMICRNERLNFVCDFLTMAISMGRSGERRKSHCHSIGSMERFLDGFLKMDGVLALRMVAIHAGDTGTVEITRRLWKEYRQRWDYDGEGRNEEGTADGQCRPLLMAGTKETLLCDS